jgi:hypothetical protein
MIINDWACVALIFCTLIVGVAAVKIQYDAKEAEVAKAAAAAGLVQQVIKFEGYSPQVLWVKPKVEK